MFELPRSRESGRRPKRKARSRAENENLNKRKAGSQGLLLHTELRDIRDRRAENLRVEGDEVKKKAKANRCLQQYTPHYHL